MAIEPNNLPEMAIKPKLAPNTHVVPVRSARKTTGQQYRRQPKLAPNTANMRSRAGPNRRTTVATELASSPLQTAREFPEATSDNIARRTRLNKINNIIRFDSRFDRHTPPALLTKDTYFDKDGARTMALYWHS